MKKKAFLASAILATSVALSSCGGGGGGTSSTTPPPPPPPPAATDVAKVLVLAQKGFTSPGALIGLFEGTVKSDGTVVWSSDLNSGDNDLDYYHEFSNNNLLLYDTGTNEFYLYSNQTLTPITQGVDYSTGNNVNVAGIAMASNYNIFLPNFVIKDNGMRIDYIITQNGKVIEAGVTGAEHLIYAGENYVVFGDGTANERVFIVKKDGTIKELDWDDATKAVDPINVGGAIVLDRVEGTDTILLGHNSTNANALFVIDDNGDVVRITNSTNAATGDDPMSNIVAGKIVKNGNNFFVAVGDNANNIEYFKVIGPVASSVVFTPTSPISGDATVTSGSFSLDGNGHLYLISDCDIDGKYELLEGFIDSSNIFNSACKNTAANDALTGYVMLSFSNGVLMSDGANFFHYIYGSSQPTNVALNPNVINAVNYCNNVNNTTYLE
ncbi:hypothetical protein [Sulfurihydrogenibium subterraneum]|uniref:hypothetical protein n=1 Tax=Sulfurihydrogenibium subterraneum TaxID=171121 RepID=UPI000491BB1A|nr:hypothetical protein [Sulfurihydrogenibium subterraneum]